MSWLLLVICGRVVACVLNVPVWRDVPALWRYRPPGLPKIGLQLTVTQRKISSCWRNEGKPLEKRDMVRLFQTTSLGSRTSQESGKVAFPVVWTQGEAAGTVPEELSLKGGHSYVCHLSEWRLYRGYKVHLMKRIRYFCKTQLYIAELQVILWLVFQCLQFYFI